MGGYTVMKRSILILSGYYLPGFKGGGPIRSISNLVNNLSDHFNFKIITSDRDLGDKEAYKGIKVNNWNKLGPAEVYYISPDRMNLGGLRKIIRHTHYDLMYINSFFSPNFSIKPLLLIKLGLVPNKPVIVAPRGEFSAGALNIKKYKKSLFINLAKIFDVHSDVLWHATSQEEKEDIQKVIGKDAKIHIASNITINANDRILKNEKQAGSLKIIFLSRITWKKNLRGALEYLTSLTGNVYFDIYGPIEDKLYWKECQEIADSLPSNIHVKYLGEISNDKVSSLFSQYDIFLFPTLGENYGHVIVEAILSGCPVVISDQTPWNDLEENNAGWVIPLENKDKFHNVLQSLVEMDNTKYQMLLKNTLDYGKVKFLNQDAIEQHKALFNRFFI
jgi:glycosyltransferase involved in cell wall biosynthesis